MLKVNKDYVSAIIISVFGGIIVNYFLPKTTDIFYFLFNEYYIPRVIYLIVIFFIVAWLFLSKRKTWEELNRPVGFSITKKPDYVRDGRVITSFGVRWRVFVGSDRLVNLPGDRDYYHVEGPFCPKCNYKMDVKHVPTKLGISSKHCWYCNDCNKFFDRPKKQLGVEEDVVIKQVQKDIEKKNLSEEKQ